MKEKEIIAYPFDTVGRVMDYGVQISRIEIYFGDDIDRFASKEFEVLNGDKKRKILEIKKEGNNLLLELEIGLEIAAGRALKWNDELFSNEEREQNYSVKVVGEDVKFYKKEYRVEEVDRFTFGEKEGFKYATYKPQLDGKKHPLIIWLHGAGEGGDNSRTQILANRGGVAFTTAENQEIFDNPYVLAPQCPTFWLNNFLIKDKKGKNRVLVSAKDYTSSLLKLIKEYINENQEIDLSRVYLGGCSMGGYQSLKVLAMDPKLFAAAFISCPAACISFEELNRIKDIPIWLVHASSDTIVTVENSRTIYRYLKSKKSDVEYTEYKDIYCDGKLFDAHASYFDMLNNLPHTDSGVHIFNWISSKEKNC